MKYNYNKQQQQFLLDLIYLANIIIIRLRVNSLLKKRHKRL